MSEEQSTDETAPVEPFVEPKPGPSKESSSPSAEEIAVKQDAPSPVLPEDVQKDAATSSNRGHTLKRKKHTQPMKSGASLGSLFRLASDLYTENPCGSSKSRSNKRREPRSTSTRWSHATFSVFTSRHNSFCEFESFASHLRNPSVAAPSFNEYSAHSESSSSCPSSSKELCSDDEPKKKKQKTDGSMSNKVLNYFKSLRYNSKSADDSSICEASTSASVSDSKDVASGPLSSDVLGNPTWYENRTIPSLLDTTSKETADSHKLEQCSGVKRDEAYYYGLFGATEECDAEEKKPNCCAWVPVPILELIFCQVPFHDLMNLRLVCKTWHSVIGDNKFAEWKKAYYRFKANGEHDRCLKQAVTSQHFETGVANCFRSLIKFMAYTYLRRPHPQMLQLLRSARKFKDAEAVLLERFPDMSSENLNPWCVMVTQVLLSQTVWDVYSIMNCLLYTGSPCSAVDILDAMYCIATFLLHFKVNYKINHGLHYRVYYALYLFENTIPKNLPIPITKLERVITGQQSLHTYWQPLDSKFTFEQMRILNHRLAPRQVVKVIAFAGTGKTTTLVNYCKLYPQLKFLNVVFNKSVQEHAHDTFPKNVKCRTSHSVAYQALGKQFRHKLCFKLKPHDIVSYLNKPDTLKMHNFTFAKYVLQTVEAFIASADEAITTAHVKSISFSQYNSRFCNAVSVRDKQWTSREYMAIAKEAERIWSLMINPTNDFKIVHDAYLKLFQLTHPVLEQYDCILIDEAQDCNDAMLNIMLSQSIPVILVGDPNQQIYSFRGAKNALASIPATHTYHLTKSFRFGPEIAYIASCCIEVLKCNSQKTLVGSSKKCYVDGTVKGQYAVITRTSAQLIQEAIRLCCKDIRRGNEPEIVFGCFAGGIGGYGLEQLLDIYRLSTHEKDQIKRIKDKFIMRFASFDELYCYMNNAEDIELHGKMNLVHEHRANLESYIPCIKKKCGFPIEVANVIFSTAHKSKGLEFDTVSLTNDYSIGSVPCERPIADSPLGDEYNVLYVALTRAKQCLLLSEPLYKVLLLAQEKFEYPVLSKNLVESCRALTCTTCSTEFIPHTALVLYRQPTQMWLSTYRGGPLCMNCGTKPRFRPEIHRASAIIYLDFVEDLGHRSMSALVGPLPTDPPITYDDLMMPYVGAQPIVFHFNLR